MRALAIAVLLTLVAVVGVEAAQWFNHTRAQPMQQDAFMSSTTAAPTPPSGVNNSAGTQSSTANTAGAWATFIDGDGLYSIQYPTNQGTLSVATSTTAGTTDPVTDLILEGTAPDWNSLDVWVTPNDPTLQSYMRTHVDLIPQGSISEPGMTGTIYKESDDGAIIVFLSGTGPGATSTFYISFDHAEMGLTPNDVPLPTYWRQMLDSFQVLTRK